MIPAGYMAKYVATRPEWLKADRVADIYSVSHCVSNDFADYIDFWKHNGYWFFDTPEIIQAVAKEHSLDLTSTKLFYYEVYEQEYDEKKEAWRHFSPEPSFTTHIIEPNSKTLEGFDIVTFYARTSAECSPLSCNALASEVETNTHCLLSSFRQAKDILENGQVKNTEPGPYRIFAVYSVQWP
jgi:hypothetical protein